MKCGVRLTAYVRSVKKVRRRHFQKCRPVLANKAHFALQYSLRNLPDGPVEAQEIFGPNMVFRRSVFDNAFRFDETMGRTGDGDDGRRDRILRRVERSGARAWFTEAPRVEHIIRTNHMSRSYWARRFYRHGRGLAQQTWDAGTSRRPTFCHRDLLIRRGASTTRLGCSRHLRRRASTVYRPITGKWGLRTSGPRRRATADRP